jgi:hypothetical protein
MYQEYAETRGIDVGEKTGISNFSGSLAIRGDRNGKE